MTFRAKLKGWNYDLRAGLCEALVAAGVRVMPEHYLPRIATEALTDGIRIGRGDAWPEAATLDDQCKAVLGIDPEPFPNDPHVDYDRPTLEAIEELLGKGKVRMSTREIFIRGGEPAPKAGDEIIACGELCRIESVTFDAIKGTRAFVSKINRPSWLDAAPIRAPQ